MLAQVRRLREHVGEVVVVDSSRPDRWAELDRGLVGPSERVVRAVPVGYPDVLVAFGVNALGTDWVLHCDPDEEPTTGLLARLRNLGGADGYIVPRFEATVGATTRHLRLFRRDRYAPANPSYAFPPIRGTVRCLPPSEGFVHRRDYSSGVSADYQERIMDLESFERPPDGAWLRAAFTLPWGARPVCFLPFAGRFGRSGLLPRAGVWLGRLVGTAVDFVATRSVRYARYAWRYRRAAVAFVDRLSPEERALRYRITLDARTNGGLTRYLRFDDAEYLRNLTATFPWDVEGTEVLHALLRTRFESGRPLATWPRAGQTA